MTEPKPSERRLRKVATIIVILVIAAVAAIFVGYNVYYAATPADQAVGSGAD